MCVCICTRMCMEVSPYLCLSKNTFISLQKYLHLSPVKHILLIENHCRKQFWNCHLRLTCKIKQREKGIITHSSRQTSAWFISVLMNATACDCTLYGGSLSLGWVSASHKMNTLMFARCSQTPSPAAPSLTHTEKSAQRSVGRAPSLCQTASSGHAALPWLQTPLNLRCLPEAHGDGLAQDLDGMDRSVTTLCCSGRWAL